MRATLSISLKSNETTAKTPTELAYYCAYTCADQGLSADCLPLVSSMANGTVERGVRIELHDVSSVPQIRRLFWALSDVAIRITDSRTGNYALGLKCAYLTTELWEGCLMDASTLEAFGAENHDRAVSGTFPSDPNAPGGPSRTDYVNR